MPLGDYTKTTFINGSAPAINATNLNNAEDKIAELDTKAIEKPTTATGDNLAVFDTNQNKLKDSGKSFSDVQDNTKTYYNATYADEILAGGTLTKNIAIGSGNNHGIVVIRRNTTGTSRHLGIICFISSTNTSTLVSGYTSTASGGGGAWARPDVGYITDTGRLGENVCNSSGDIVINECYIDGSNLRIDFENKNGEDNKNLDINVHAEVW